MSELPYASVYPNQSTVWKQLSEHHKLNRQMHLRNEFSKDPERAERFFISAANLYLDYSKNLITDETLNLLKQLTEESGLPQAIKALFAGENINNSEERPALHVALRNPDGDPFMVDGHDVSKDVKAALIQMEKFVWSIHSAQRRGYTNKRFTDIVHLGIGGSYLGPKVVSAALKPYWKAGLNLHYVANIDGTHITEELKHLSPETTLFIIASKSFGTQETIKNAISAKQWFLRNGGEEQDVHKHFVAISSNKQRAYNFGIREENIFPMWDWVGGRYSLWSTIGLPIALTIGIENFKALLAGAHEMDEHFKTAPFEQNIPMILAVLGVWYNNFFNADSHAILPYDHYLRALPAHIQQLDMESNGKSVTHSGDPVEWSTGPVIWGGAGANGQHAYHQLLHQGTHFLPVDFIMPLRTHNHIGDHHALLLSNCLSQSQALMQGKTLEEAKEELRSKGKSEEQVEELAPHKVIPGNRPSNMILFEKSTPRTIGALIAMYEHKVFAQGVLWNINSFDQWGVELGKELGQNIYDIITGDQSPNGQDSSTKGLIDLFKKVNNRI
jgi:glucose-6-phosphate isomerase